MQDLNLSRRVANLDPMMLQQQMGNVPYVEGMTPQNYEQPSNIPMRGADDLEMNNKILESVLGAQAMKNIKAPKVTQEEAKRYIASTGGGESDNVSMSMSAPIPNEFMGKMQKEKDKTHQEIIKEFMKKREALAKNAEDRAKIVGGNFTAQADLSPLMAFADQMHGTNLNQSYKAPETQQQNLRAQQGFENQARQEYGSLTDDQMNILRQEFGQKQALNRVDAADKDRELRREALQAKRASLGMKPLPAESIKRLDYIVDGSTALSRMRTAINNGAMRRPDIPMIGDNDFTSAMRDAAEQYGRMQSGGAISKPEEDRFIKAVWKMGDSKEETLKKIDKQMQMFEGRKTRLMSGGREGVANTPTNNANKYRDPKFIAWRKSKGL